VRLHVVVQEGDLVDHLPFGCDIVKRMIKMRKFRNNYRSSLGDTRWKHLDANGVSVDTVGRGAAELEAGIVADGRVRAPGAGRKPAEQTDPRLWTALDRLVDPETRGDPNGPPP
jgi:hypothetical protein